jgi:YHS domain-containing protein
MLIILLVSSTVAAVEPVSKSYFGSVAIGGVDAFSYHLPEVRKAHKVMLGDGQFMVEWKGAKWHFASQQSADKFSSDPERYQPTYNGFCSNALSLGEGLIKTDGRVWEFFGETLHLFYAERGRQRWLQGDWETYKKEADNAWGLLSKQEEKK